MRNAAFQRTHDDELQEIADEASNRHFATNIGMIFHLCKAPVPHMQAGGSIINTASVNVDQPNCPDRSGRG